MTVATTPLAGAGSGDHDHDHEAAAARPHSVMSHNARESIDPKLAVIAQALEEKEDLSRAHQSALEKPHVELTDRKGSDQDGDSWDADATAEEKSRQKKPSEQESKAVLKKIDRVMMPMMCAVYLLTFLDKVHAVFNCPAWLCEPVEGSLRREADDWFGLLRRLRPIMRIYSNFKMISISTDRSIAG
jgi:hypothetical protein